MAKSSSGLRAIFLGLAMSQALAGVALAQAATPPPGPMPRAEKSIAAAPAGAYLLDPDHSAVLARTSHLGFSFSVFRFDKVQGTLAWNPADVGASKLDVTVQPGSVATNVEGFAPEIAGDKFLKSGAYPTARFVSTAFRQTDATHGQVDGQLTLMGKTKAVTFDVVLVGAGKWFGEEHVIGVNARTTIDPQDYGLPAAMGNGIELVIDTEFRKKG